MKHAILWMPLSANLFRLESSFLPRAKRATNRNNVATEKRNKLFFSVEFFFLLIFEIYMKDFYFSSYGHCCDVITPIFDDNSKNKYRRIFFIIFPVLFSTLRTFYKVSITSEREGGQHVRNWEKAFTWNMRNVLKRLGNQFSDFYFSSYGHFVPKITPIFNEFSPITWNIKTAKNCTSFFIYSSHSAFFKEIWSLLRGGESAYPSLGQGPITI